MKKEIKTQIDTLVKYDFDDFEKSLSEAKLNMQKERARGKAQEQGWNVDSVTYMLKRDYWDDPMDLFICCHVSRLETDEEYESRKERSIKAKKAAIKRAENKRKKGLEEAREMLKKYPELLNGEAK